MVHASLWLNYNIEVTYFDWFIYSWQNCFKLPSEIYFVPDVVYSNQYINTACINRTTMTKWRVGYFTFYNKNGLHYKFKVMNRNESGRFGALKSDSTHHFFRNACTKSGSLRFSQFYGCWLILSVYIIMSFDFPFVRLFGVR